MLNVNPVEIGVVAGAFVLFFFVPLTLLTIESRRRRKAEVTARRLAEAEAVAASPAEPVADPVPPAVTEQALSTDEPVVVEEAVAVDDVVVVHEPDVVEEAVVPTPVETPEGSSVTFRLDDLRRARVLEAPPREVLDDPALQREWEEGLRLAEAHAAVIGATELNAAFEPQSRCFAGMRDLGEVKELRFFLFAGLWPTASDQAVGEAVFELTGDAIDKANVVRR